VLDSNDIPALRVEDAALRAEGPSLRGPGDPPVFTVVDGHGDSPWVLVCDHGGRAIPRALGSLGLPDSELERHIAWDIGAAAVTRRLAARLGAWAIVGGYSRLVIDLNRPVASPQSILPRSEATDVPGNVGLPAREAAARRREFFDPYHQRITRELDRRRDAGLPAILVAVHSFTPVYLGAARPWHAGVLYNREKRLARILLETMPAEEGLVVGDNQPYAVSDATDWTVVTHGEGRGLHHVELEMRQDLIAEEAGQEAWASRLARLLEQARSRLGC
jgi:predicted N-formylglutamate amidohydrolase